MNEQATLPRVLVADDDPGIRNLLQAVLKEEGLEVTTVGDGAGVLAELEDGTPPDLIILDMQMPLMDGREAFREMRARGYHIPVLVLTAFGASAATRELGAEGAMGKPFDIEALVQLVEDLIGSQPAHI